MLPHSHFIIAALVIIPVEIILFPENSAIQILKLTIVGGFLSAAIDLDVFTTTFLKSRSVEKLKAFRNPVEIYRKFESFMDTISETGVLKIGLKTHIISSTILAFIFYFYANNYFVPALLGILSHLISDIKNIRRINDFT